MFLQFIFENGYTVWFCISGGVSKMFKQFVMLRKPFPSLNVLDALESVSASLVLCLNGIGLRNKSIVF
jgi:hypothetical protein